MNVENKTHVLTVLMLKSYVDNLTDVIKKHYGVKVVDIPLGTNKAKLYFKQNPRQAPNWVKLFMPLVGDSLGSLFNSATSAALIVQVGAIYFALRNENFCWHNCSYPTSKNWLDNLVK